MTVNSQDAIGGCAPAPARRNALLSIASQLGDHRPGPKVYEFTGWADPSPSYQARHYARAEELLNQLGEPQNRGEAILIALVEALLSLELGE